MLQENLKFIALTNVTLGEDQNSIKDKIELIKQTRKKIYKIERLKTEIEEITEWEFKSFKLLDLNFEKHDEIAEIAKIEIRLEALGISKNNNNKKKQSMHLKH